MVTRSCRGAWEGCPSPPSLIKGWCRWLEGAVREQISEHRLWDALSTHHATCIPPSLRRSRDTSAKPALFCQAVAVAPPVRATSAAAALQPPRSCRAGGRIQIALSQGRAVIAKRSRGVSP